MDTDPETAQRNFNVDKKKKLKKNNTALSAQTDCDRIIWSKLDWTFVHRTMCWSKNHKKAPLNVTHMTAIFNAFIQKFCVNQAEIISSSLKKKKNDTFISDSYHSF